MILEGKRRLLEKQLADLVEQLKACQARIELLESTRAGLEAREADLRRELAELRELFERVDQVKADGAAG